MPRQRKDSPPALAQPGPDGNGEALKRQKLLKSAYNVTIKDRYAHKAGFEIKLEKVFMVGEKTRVARIAIIEEGKVVGTHEMEFNQRTKMTAKTGREFELHCQDLYCDPYERAIARRESFVMLQIKELNLDAPAAPQTTTDGHADGPKGAI